MQAVYQVERRIEHILFWLTLHNCITIHGTKNVEFSSVMLGSLSWWLVKLGWFDLWQMGLIECTETSLTT